MHRATHCLGEEAALFLLHMRSEIGEPFQVVSRSGMKMVRRGGSFGFPLRIPSKGKWKGMGYVH